MKLCLGLGGWLVFLEPIKFHDDIEYTFKDDEGLPMSQWILLLERLALSRILDYGMSDPLSPHLHVLVGLRGRFQQLSQQHPLLQSLSRHPPWIYAHAQDQMHRPCCPSLSPLAEADVGRPYNSDQLSSQGLPGDC